MQKLAPIEKVFADIIWQKAPIGSGELVKICNEVLHWSNSTTYTMIKRFTLRGLIENKNSIVRCLVTKDEYNSKLLDEMIKDDYNGSLAHLVCAYCDNGDSLSEKEIQQLKELVNRYEANNR